MKLLLSYLTLLVLILTLGSCTKNELTLQGTITESAGQSLTIIYRAADKEKSFLVENPMPLSAEGAFTLKAATRMPTVLWVLTAVEGKLLIPIYAERGDELTLSGKYNDPYRWTVEGNKVMEQYCEWQQANVNAFMSDDSTKLNDAIAAYVKKNPDSRTAAFILFTRFNTSGYEAQYSQLVSALTLDEDDLKEMKEACMAPEFPNVGKESIPTSISLTALNDSLSTVSLKGKGTTLIYFWRDNASEPAKEMLRQASARKQGQSINVYMDTDTMTWHRMLDADTTLKVGKSLWAPGGETNRTLKPLNIPTTPYFIVTDNAGKTLYRGSDPKTAAAKLQ